MIEVNSETDFCAKNAEFVGFVDNLSKLALTGNAADMDAFMALEYQEGGTVQEALTNKISTIGENMNIRRFQKIAVPGTKNVGYIHGGREPRLRSVTKLIIVSFPGRQSYAVTAKSHRRCTRRSGEAFLL